MSDQDQEEHLPPKGDTEKAEQYLNQLIQLINEDKLEVIHTDLTKFDPSALEDHYRIDLKEYQVEISHSKQPNSGMDSYVMLFTNIQNIKEGCDQKLILAYIHLASDQYKKFKLVADDQIERKRKAEEERKFKEAMAPIDQILGDIVSKTREEPEEDTSSVIPKPYFAPSDSPKPAENQNSVLQNIFDSSLPNPSSTPDAKQLVN